MAEQVTLTTPVPQATITDYRIVQVNLRLLPFPFIQVEVVNNGGVNIIHGYEGQTARTMLSALNKGNFTVNSFAKTVLNRLIADGVLVGTVTGTPE